MAFIKSLDYIDIKGVRISLFFAEFTGTGLTLLYLQELTTELFLYYYYLKKTGGKKEKGEEKGKKIRHPLPGGYFTANFSTKHVISPFITKFCWGKSKGPS